MKHWDKHDNFDAAEKKWDASAKEAEDSNPLKILRHLPNMPGITSDTARNLKWKSLKYLVKHDEKRILPRHFFKHPIKYTQAFIKSLLKNKPFTRDGDFFYYGVHDEDDFKEKIKSSEALIVIGFSYCHKPFECPSGRFTDNCIHDLASPVCKQCFIGKAVHALPSNVTILYIPTIHYIGEKIFELTHNHPDKKIFFLITACEMTLKMFGDWGNMVGARGIGVRLDGRICNTMHAFELSERGVKPGLTVVLDETQKRMLELIKYIRTAV
ncbi:MAG: hypothetical protein V4494_05215 [Chlamydiota bacterium]